MRRYLLVIVLVVIALVCSRTIRPVREFVWGYDWQTCVEIPPSRLTVYASESEPMQAHFCVANRKASACGALSIDHEHAEFGGDLWQLDKPENDTTHILVERDGVTWLINAITPLVRRATQDEANIQVEAPRRSVGRFSMFDFKLRFYDARDPVRGRGRC
jgi:hypothetical protein